MYLAEVHGLDTLATQCRTDGRRGRGLTGADDDAVEVRHAANALRRAALVGHPGTSDPAPASGAVEDGGTSAGRPACPTRQP